MEKIGLIGMEGYVGKTGTILVTHNKNGSFLLLPGGLIIKASTPEIPKELIEKLAKQIDEECLQSLKEQADKMANEAKKLTANVVVLRDLLKELQPTKKRKPKYINRKRWK